MKTTPRDLTPIEIRCRMLEKNVSQSGIARSLGITQSAVYQVIEGRAVSHPIREKIAAALGMEPARIWPSTYLTGGPRKAGRPVNHAKAA